ncbi:MAG: hypothetical protein V3T14_07415 [Myxococcota bacterium]
MQLLTQLFVAILIGSLIVPLPLLARGRGTHSLWVHPSGETFDPTRHYRDAEGNLFYLEENNVGGPVGAVHFGAKGKVRVDLGLELLARAERSAGALVPVFLYDSDADGIIDRTQRGHMEAERAVFDLSRIPSFDPQTTRWQLGVRYAAGETGDAALDGRYLASVDGRNARITVEAVTAKRAAPVQAQEPELPPVSAARPTPGLVVLRHREGTPFDLAGFVDQPARYIEHFETLTRKADGDAWTMEGDRGRVVTELDREDLLLVRTEDGFQLEVTWAGVPFERFLKELLEVPMDRQGCYVSLNSGLKNPDGSPATPPHRLMLCPQDSLALFDAPAGYEIGFAALRDGAVFEYAEASTSVADNVRLYVREIYPRQPSSRATGRVGGNVVAGFRDAGADLRDAFRHAFTGTEETHLHLGVRSYRPSPIVAPPRALWQLVRGRPLQALGELFEGAASAIQVGADVAGAIHNTVVTTFLQGTVGTTRSPASADTAGDWLGALTQSVIKNLPFGERSSGVLDPRSIWQNDRAFEPMRHTRTDTQLNIDRTMTLLDFGTLNAVRIHNRSSSSAGGGGDSPAKDIGLPLPGDGVPEAPGPP